MVVMKEAIPQRVYAKTMQPLRDVWSGRANKQIEHLIHIERVLYPIGQHINDEINEDIDNESIC